MVLSCIPCKRKKSARAEEYIRMIKERLPEAVLQCIDAPAGEHEPAIQRGLLRVSIVSEVVMATT